MEESFISSKKYDQSLKPFMATKSKQTIYDISETKIVVVNKKQSIIQKQEKKKINPKDTKTIILK